MAKIYRRQRHSRDGDDSASDDDDEGLSVIKGEPEAPFHCSLPTTDFHFVTH